MKILLLGEYSGFYRNLADGLNAIGVESYLCGSKDGFKNTPVDISFDSSFSGLLGKVHRRIIPFLKIKQLSNYDVVQLINPFVLRNNFFPDKYFLSRIIDSNKNFFISAAGCDAYVWRNIKSKLRYSYFDDFLKFDMKSSHFYMESDESFNFNKYILERSKGVIPVVYEYELAYRDTGRLLKTIPLPINTDKFSFIDSSKRNKKLTVFHGLNRYGFKGTRHVEKAFAVLKDKYPNDLDLIIAGNLPINEYLELLKKTDIVVDQTNSYSNGMNGLYAMAQGKIVLGGAELESLTSIGIDHSPVINIIPDYLSIVQAVENILSERNRLPELSHNSRRFVEEVHCYKKVAQKYLQVWNDNI